MSVFVPIATAIASVLTLLGLMFLVRQLAQRRNVSPEVQRKLVHIGTGLYALCLPWLFQDRWPIFMLIGMTLIVMLVLRLPAVAKSGLGNTLHGVERQSWGDILLALAIGTVFLLSNGVAILYVLPIAVLTLADAAAALTGTRYGRAFFQVEDGQKSIEGSVAFFMVTLILSMICLLLLTDIDRENVILLSVVVAAFGTLVEAESWRGFDNFFLPTGLMVFLQSHLYTPPQDLIALTIAFLVAIWLFLSAAPRLGISAHTARVYVIASFLLLSVTIFENAVLPILVFAAHGMTRRFNPGKALHGDLDIVAAVALISFAWLVIGLLTGINASWFYGLTSMGLCAGLIALALVPLEPVQKWGVAVIFGGVLVVIFTGLMAVAFGVGLSALSIISAIIMLSVPLIQPEKFVQFREGKLAIMAMALPIIGYLWHTAQGSGWL